MSLADLTVLVGGLRILNANYKKSQNGVSVKNPESLTNDYFIHLLDMNTKWKPTGEDKDIFEGTDLKTGEKKWNASRVDLIFDSNSQLRTLAKVYASDDTKEKFTKEFVLAWNKVMNADRFDLK